MKLTRFCDSETMGTFGILEIQGEKFYTVEKPFKDNKPFVSCIPLGGYALVPYFSKDFGSTVKLVNIMLKVYPDKVDDSSRYSILIHKGNTEKDVVGCIAVGLGLGFVKGQWAVTNSVDAMRKLKHLWMRENTLEIEIVDKK